MWLKLKSNLNEKYLALYLAYIPPEKSVYSNISIFTDIEDALDNLRSKNNNLQFLMTSMLEQASFDGDESIHLESLGLTWSN